MKIYLQDRLLVKICVQLSLWWCRQIAFHWRCTNDPQQCKTVSLSSDSPPHSAIKLLNLGNLIGDILNLSWVRLSKLWPYISVTSIFLFCELSYAQCLKAYLDRCENGGAITSAATPVRHRVTRKGPQLHDANLVATCRRAQKQFLGHVPNANKITDGWWFQRENC